MQNRRRRRLLGASEIAGQVGDRARGARGAPRVSVVVPHFHDLVSLDRCLADLSRQTLAAEAFEVIVGDNGSPEGEDAIAAVIDGRAGLVTVRRRGAGAARNGAAAEAQGDILAFTDCDCRPEPGWLAEGLAALASYDFVGGRMKVLVDDPASLTPVEAFETVFAFDNETYVRKKHFTVTANLFCPRVLFETVGGFGVGVSGDLDWSHRARSAGYHLGYAPAAVVGHPARRTWPQLLTKWRRLIPGELRSFQVSPGRPLGVVLRAAVLPASALWHTPRVLFSRKLVGPGQRLGSLMILFRIRLWRSLDACKLLFSSAPQ